MSLKEELQSLITQPREDLNTEHKYWLDLSINEDKAKLAKAAIALANHGGGYIVIGFKENERILESQQEPNEISPITQDLVNQAIHRFTEPKFQCDVYYITHPDTGMEHPVITVPGDLTVPVISRRSCKDIIGQNRCYIRKPGPKSEEPQTSEEWRTLFIRCVRANKEDMLDAFRAIMAGNIEMQVTKPNAEDELRNYITNTRQYWKETVKNKPKTAPARFPHGYYEIAFSLIGNIDTKDVTALKAQLNEAGQCHHTGWPVFPMLRDLGWEPRPYDKFIEAHLGIPNYENDQIEESHHCNFWRASLEGKLYAICGYREDSQEEPGKVLYDSSLIWRLGEGILFSNRYAKTFNKIEQIMIYCHFTGIKGRHIKNAEMPDLRRDIYMSNIPQFSVKTQAAPKQIENNLSEIVHSILI